MATAAKKDSQAPRPYTERQKAVLGIAEAMVRSIGYELLDHRNGEVAADIARRAVGIVDAAVKAAS